mgnify:CR=1 FL=1
MIERPFHFMKRKIQKSGENERILATINGKPLLLQEEGYIIDTSR